MQIVAQSKSVRMSPRKVRLVASALKNMSAEKALAALSLMEKRAADSLEKTVKSAIANAVNNAKVSHDTLVIDRIEVTEGQAMKRFRPSTRGRVHPYKKRTSHITVVLTDDKNQKSKGKNQK